MDFKEVLNNRYSVRSFKDQSLTDEEIYHIMELANTAPSSKNLQPFNVYFIKSEEKLEKINSVCKCIYGAKTVCVITNDTKSQWQNKRRGTYATGEIDATILSTYIMLSAQSLGISTCMVAMFNDQEVIEALDIPQGEVPVLIMPIGYKSEDSKPLDMHNKRKDIKSYTHII